MKKTIALALFALMISIEGIAAENSSHHSSVPVCGSQACNVHTPANTATPALIHAGTGTEISSFFIDIFDTSKWPPRWSCGEWSSFHGWFYILSDIGISLAYFAIPFVLGILVYKRRSTGLPFPGIIILFIAFIFSCGLTHLTDAGLFWLPAYKFSALIRFITAVVSIGAVFALIRVAPEALRFKSPEELEKIIEQRTNELQAANKQLGRTNEELANANRQLKAEMAQRELAESEAGVLLESIPQLAWTADTSGEILYQNKVFLDFTGADYLDLKRMTQQVVHPEDVAKNLPLWMRAVKTGEPYEVQERMRTKEGEYRWMLTRALPIRNQENEIVKWIGTSTDIHEQKINEQRKDTFLNISSHELKTPLTIASAYTQLICEHEKVTQNAELNIYCKKIKTHIVKMEKLIEELLDVSRIDAGKMNYDMQTEDFDQMIRDSVEDFKSISPANNKIELTGESGAVVNCDRAKINQVVYNLLTNAIRYSPENKPVQISLHKSDNMVLCRIKDWGTGIPKGEIPKIFNKFYRTANNTTAGGLGLGLYISNEIIKRHNGQIEVESEEGKGTVFQFSLPFFNR